MAGGGGVLLLAQLTNNQAPIEMCCGLGPNCSKTTLWEINDDLSSEYENYLTQNISTRALHVRLCLGRVASLLNGTTGVSSVTSAAEATGNASSIAEGLCSG